MVTTTKDTWTLQLRKHIFLQNQAAYQLKLIWFYANCFQDFFAREPASFVVSHVTNYLQANSLPLPKRGSCIFQFFIEYWLCRKICSFAKSLPVPLGTSCEFFNGCFQCIELVLKMIEKFLQIRKDEKSSNNRFTSSSWFVGVLPKERF